MINWEIKVEISNFLKNIKNKNILDFGCGDCRYKKYIDNSNSYVGLEVENSGHPISEKKIM